MIKVIYGQKGAGKTKRILDMANNSIGTAKGSIVFIDDDNRYMFDLKNSIRFINATEYGITGPKMFMGFLKGLTAQDFDLEYVFIDGFLRIVKHDLDTLEDMFKSMEEYSESFGVNLALSISGNEAEPPQFLEKYIV